MAANSQFAVAVHVLTLLARSGERRAKSEGLAKSVNTNPVVIRRLLSQLAHADLISSQTGAFGGSKLKREPAEINLVDVYRAVCCGEVFALHGRSPSQDCPVGRNIEAVLCNLQKEIDKSVTETLAQYTLADVLEKTGE
jgi:Rrf2 family protein